MHARKRQAKLLATLTLSLFITASFWMFSRFTVDDAFIAWRYGQNLAHHGVWNYNPVMFDVTQAYTTPLYALISTIPNLLHIDVVLFFKMLSIFLLLFFGYLFYLLFSRSHMMLLILCALPATFIHLFSGIETLLFVALVALLFIYLYEECLSRSSFIAAVLFLTRPESWPLVILVPAYFAAISISRRRHAYEFSQQPATKHNSAKGLILSCIGLIAVLSALLIFNKLYFGYTLPNTFYVKSARGFSVTSFVYFSFWLVPLLLLLTERKVLLFCVAAAFFMPVVISYSTSSLQMNYVDRFGYHVFAPVYLLGVFIASRHSHSYLYVSRHSSFQTCMKLRVRTVLNAGLLCYLLLYATKTTVTSELLHMTNYYSRALDSHAALGRLFSKMAHEPAHSIDTFCFGDAGMTAYHSGLVALDNAGLGSSLVATQSIEAALEAYSPEVLVFHSRPDGIRLNNYNQQAVYTWARRKKMSFVGEVFWRPDYTLRIYSAYDMREAFAGLCRASKAQNDLGDRQYLLRKGWLVPPWVFWHE